MSKGIGQWGKKEGNWIKLVVVEQAGEMKCLRGLSGTERKTGHTGTGRIS